MRLLFYLVFMGAFINIFTAEFVIDSESIETLIQNAPGMRNLAITKEIYRYNQLYPLRSYFPSMDITDKSIIDFNMDKRNINDLQITPNLSLSMFLPASGTVTLSGGIPYTYQNDFEKNHYLNFINPFLSFNYKQSLYFSGMSDPVRNYNSYYEEYKLLQESNIRNISKEESRIRTVIYTGYIECLNTHDEIEILKEASMILEEKYNQIIKKFEIGDVSKSEAVEWELKILENNISLKEKEDMLRKNEDDFKKNTGLNNVSHFIYDYDMYYDGNLTDDMEQLIKANYDVLDKNYEIKKEIITGIRNPFSDPFTIEAGVNYAINPLKKESYAEVFNDLNEIKYHNLEINILIKVPIDGLIKSICDDAFYINKINLLKNELSTTTIEAKNKITEIVVNFKNKRNKLELLMKKDDILKRKVIYYKDLFEKGLIKGTEVFDIEYELLENKLGIKKLKREIFCLYRSFCDRGCHRN